MVWIVIVLLVAVGAGLALFAKPAVVVVAALAAALAVLADALWVGHVSGWFAIVAAVAVQIGYVIGIAVQAALAPRQRRTP